MSRSSSPDELSSSSGSSISSFSSLDLSFCGEEFLRSPLPSSEAARRLPFELLAMIITEAASRKQAHNGVGYAEPNQPGLCLLSKSLLPVARAALYHTLIVEHSRDTLDSDEDSEYGSDSEFLNFSTDAKLRRTLKNNPSLGRRCRRLNVQVYLGPNVDLEEEPVFEWIKEVMKSCPEVQDFEIGSDDDRSYADFDSILAEFGALGWGSQLRSLKASYSGPGFLTFLESLPHLKQLRIYDNVFPLEELPTPSSVPFSLVSLNSTDQLPTPFLCTLISHSKSTLKTVNLDHTLILGQPALLCSLVALEELAASLYGPNQDVDGTLSDDDILAVVDRIRSRTNLKKLELGAMQPLPAPLLALMPSTLSSLDLTSFSVSLEDITRYLRVDYHPRLRLLKCDRRLWSLEDRAGIVAVCEELGIELKGLALDLGKFMEQNL